MNFAHDRRLLSGNAVDISRRIDPEEAILLLNTSIETLERHMEAMKIAKQQLETKRDALLQLTTPLEAETVQVF